MVHTVKLMCNVGVKSEVNVTLYCRESLSSGIGDGATMCMHQHSMIINNRYTIQLTIH